MTESSDRRGLVFALLTYVVVFALKLGAYLVDLPLGFRTID
jgi:hypothetical protein